MRELCNAKYQGEEIMNTTLLFLSLIYKKTREGRTTKPEKQCRKMLCHGLTCNIFAIKILIAIKMAIHLTLISNKISIV